jgi:hypothetical protein
VFVFLFANLVEDHSIHNPDGSAAEHEYFQFPLTSLYKLPNGVSIVPKTTRLIPAPDRRTESIWTEQDLHAIASSRMSFVVMRLWPEDAEFVLADLQHAANRIGYALHFQLKSQPSNRILIAEICVLDGDGDVTFDGRRNCKHTLGPANTIGRLR